MKRKWGDRRDAKLLRNIDSMHYIMPLMYPNRCDNEAYISETLDLTNVMAYLEKKNAVISVGKPITYDPEQSLDEQREKIIRYLRDNIDRLGRALPVHKPVSFMQPRWYTAYGQYEDDVAGYWRMIENNETE